MRKRLYEIVELSKNGDKPSAVYDFCMILTIIASILPLIILTESPALARIDRVTMILFMLDYFFRLITADYQLKQGKASFFLYPLTPMALIDLLCILSSLSIVSSTLRLFRIFRFFQAFRFLRIFKAVRYSKSLQMLVAVLKKQRAALIMVGGVAVLYILVSALIVFIAEPYTFDHYFNAVYWAAISLTTIGYGDYYPVTAAGKLVTIISALGGVAVVVLPASIITSGLMQELGYKAEVSRFDPREASHDGDGPGRVTGDERPEENKSEK